MDAHAKRARRQRYRGQSQGRIGAQQKTRKKSTAAECLHPGPCVVGNLTQDGSSREGLFHSNEQP